MRVAARLSGILRSTAALAVFGLLLAGGAWPAAAHAVVYGAAVGGDFAYLARGTWTADQVRASLAKLHAAGASVARADADWARTEPKGPVGGHHHYDRWATRPGRDGVLARPRGCRVDRDRGGHPVDHGSRRPRSQ